MKSSLVFLLVVSLVCSLFTVPAAAEKTVSTLYVKKVDNLPDDFIFGMDISSVLAEEASGVKYYGFDGNEADLFRLLADNGIPVFQNSAWEKLFE